MKQGETRAVFSILAEVRARKKTGVPPKKNRLLSLSVLKNHAESGKQSGQHHDADH